MNNQKILKEKKSENIRKEVEMAKRKKRQSKETILFLKILRWLFLALAILFFIWLVKNLGWLKL